MNNYDWLDGYLLNKTGAVKDFKAEWGWFRYMVGGKMFAAMCEPGLQYKTYGGHELLSLKCEPMLSELMRAEYEAVKPGFYMDKVNWISIFLDGDVPEAVVKDLCDRSYELVFGTLTKKLQNEIRL